MAKDADVLKNRDNFKELWEKLLKSGWGRGWAFENVFPMDGLEFFLCNYDDNEDLYLSSPSIDYCKSIFSDDILDDKILYKFFSSPQTELKDHMIARVEKELSRILKESFSEQQTIDFKRVFGLTYDEYYKTMVKQSKEWLRSKEWLDELSRIESETV